MGFPIKDVVAQTFYKKYHVGWQACLKVNSTVYWLDETGKYGECTYPGSMPQVEFTELPEAAQDFFVDKLTDLNIPLNARGLFKLPEFEKVEERGDFSIWKKRIRMRKNNYRIHHGEQEVHKAETVRQARQWCDANTEDN